MSLFKVHLWILEPEAGLVTWKNARSIKFEARPLVGVGKQKRLFNQKYSLLFFEGFQKFWSTSSLCHVQENDIPFRPVGVVTLAGCTGDLPISTRRRHSFSQCIKLSGCVHIAKKSYIFLMGSYRIQTGFTRGKRDGSYSSFEFDRITLLCLWWRHTRPHRSSNIRN